MTQMGQKVMFELENELITATEREVHWIKGVERKQGFKQYWNVLSHIEVTSQPHCHLLWTGFLHQRKKWLATLLPLTSQGLTDRDFT